MSIVGRESELNVLWGEVTAAVDTSSGRTLFVQGAPGVGKTALVTELLERLARERPGMALARGRSQQAYGSADPYLPFVDALRDLADEGTSGHVQKETIAELLGELAPYWLSVIPMVGSILSAGFLTAVRLRGKPKAAPSQEALFVQYLELIERLAERGPLVLFLDDLHRADQASVGLLTHLCRGVARLPVAIIGALQPAESGADEHPIHDVILELEREQLAARMEVGELGREALVELLAAELGGEISEPLQRHVAETTGGNPLFARELCCLLKQSGTLLQEGGLWRIVDVGHGVELPRSAEAVVSKRIERLDAEDLRLLQYASIQGTEFSSAVLARLLEIEELPLLDRLEALERQERLVFAAGEASLPGGEVATVFRFASPLLQTSLYREVVGKRRALLHRRAAEIIEELFRDALVPVAGELAWHFREGRVAEAAERYARMAEEAARRLHAEWRPGEEGSRDPLPPGDAPGDGGSAPEAGGSEADAAASFVGREEELSLLAREIALAVELSVGRTVFVQGPPGAGKTTLVSELLQRVGRERPTLTVARGRCLPTFGSADPYLPFVEALKDISDERTLGFTEKESFSELLSDIAPFWISAVPVVGDVLSATLSTASALRAKPKPDIAPSREALFVQYVELLRRLSERSPIVLFFDDLHWADQSSVALLAHLVRGIERLPVVVIGTLRDAEPGFERHPLSALIAELEREELARRVEVRELAGEALDALLAAEFGGDVSEPLRRHVVETAGGNPLFASELCRLLKQSGAAVEVKGEWLLTDAIARLEVPRSAEAVIEKRVQRLDPTAVRLLQYASVQGNEFNSLVLSRLLQMEELEVLDRLEALARQHQMVRVSGETTLPEGESATLVHFRHALIQTVLYQQVVGKRRILLHRRTGEILQSLFRGEEESIAGRLARHFHQGRWSESAYRFARMAADAARRVFAHWEAEELYRIALEHSPDGAATVQLEERLGNVYDAVGYYPQGITTYGSALEKCEDPGTAFRLRRKMVVLERKAGLIPAPALLQRVRALLTESDDYPAERCHLLLELGRLPDATEAVEAAAEALRFAESSGESALLTHALEQYARVLIFHGRPREALSHLERAMSVSSDDPPRAIMQHNLAGIAYAKLGRYTSASRHFEECLEAAERIGEPNGIGIACGCLGRLLMRMGRFEEAEANLQRARITHERRSRGEVVHPLYNLADRALMAGEWELALQRYRELLAGAEQLGYWTFAALAHAGAGLCLMELGRGAEARAGAERTRASVAGHEEWFEGRETVETFLARMELRDRHPRAAEQRLARAARALEHNDVYLYARVQMERVRVLTRSHPEEARALLDHLAVVTAGIESPPLHAELAAARGALESAPAAIQPVAR